jgi:DNA polymerase V
MYAIVDCNSFYCSCERLFMPHLYNKPVVVLSNNDGCIVSRTDEAKALGIDMAVPYFQSKDIIEQKGVTVFSSNYNLYGDLSYRVMEVLRQVAGQQYVEVYSVDEAFINLASFTTKQINNLAIELKEQVELCTGIKVSVGVAPTKTLSKMANKLAKQNKQKTNCIVILNNNYHIQKALQRTPVGDIWGIGRQYARKLKDTFHIYSAYDLSLMSENFAHTNLGGVVGKRLLRELNGIPSIVMKDELVTKKMIATTRMFGATVTSITDIKEAVATYTARAAEKLRRQYSAATTISVFVVAKPQNPNEGYRGNTISAYTVLPQATCITNDLIKCAMALVDKLVQDGKPYKKAGVTLSGIVPDASVQGNLFVPATQNTNRKLMQAVDNINFSQRDDILKFAASGTVRNWKMRQELRSKCYTTRWNELYEVR